VLAATLQAQHFAHLDGLGRVAQCGLRLAHRTSVDAGGAAIRRGWLCAVDSARSTLTPAARAGPLLRWSLLLTRARFLPARIGSTFGDVRMHVLKDVTPKHSVARLLGFEKAHALAR
jgi:hypothetical protein